MAEYNKLHANKEENCKKMIEILKTIRSNPWQPIPLTTVDKFEEEIEVIQENIEPTELLIEYSPDAEMCGNKEFKLEYEVTTKMETQKGVLEAYKQSAVKLNFPKSIKRIMHGTANLTLIGSSLFFFSKSLGQTQIKLDEFATQGTIRTRFKLMTENTIWK